MNDDMNDMIKEDVEKFKNVRKGGVSKPHPKNIIQSVLFSMAILSLIFMVISLPFVGQDKLISGQVWIGVSIVGIVLFGGAGMAIKLFLPKGEI